MTLHSEPGRRPGFEEPSRIIRIPIENSWGRPAGLPAGAIRDGLVPYWDDSGYDEGHPCLGLGAQPLSYRNRMIPDKAGSVAGSALGGVQ